MQMQIEIWIQVEYTFKHKYEKIISYGPKSEVARVQER